MDETRNCSASTQAALISWGAVVLAMAVGLLQLVQLTNRMSATYDEVTYVEVAARWWHTGEQSSITRMGSPLTFWKLQQAPTLWLLDQTGRGTLIDAPIEHLPVLLPVLRRGALWIWCALLIATASWAGWVYGPWARAASAWILALEPNLVAHSALITMELPVTACATVASAAWWWHLNRGGRLAWFVCALALGVGFSCKFTMILFPALFGVTALLHARSNRQVAWIGAVKTGLIQTVLLALALVFVNLLVTGFARLPLSEQVGAHPAIEARLGPTLAATAAHIAESSWPADWVGFLTQMRHQSGGGSSYLMGERALRGWWYYYLIAAAFKLPLGLFALAAARIVVRPRTATDDRILVIVPMLFLLIASLGSARNYGVRYLLPILPIAAVWISGLARQGARAGLVLVFGLAFMATEIAAAHPHQLSFFNRLAGGLESRRHLLSDSNLDWGQGLIELARMQRTRPELSDLTFYYFGLVDPSVYGVQGRFYVVDAGEAQPELPKTFEAKTAYVAVSASLKWGPWGPEGYFRRLNAISPVANTADGTIAVFDAADLRAD